MSVQSDKPVFRDLSAEDPDPEVTEIESLCINCHKNGMTRLLLTRIPHYKNVVIMSFSCEECGYANNEIQPGGAIAEHGVRWQLDVQCEEDLNRQIVKSDYTGIVIPELDFEIPPQSQKGEVTTVEGIISRVISGLSQEQDKRRQEHPEAAAKIDLVVAKLLDLKVLGRSWTLQIEDISGNSFIENPYAPSKDPRCKQTEFKRTTAQNHMLGIFMPDEVSDDVSVKTPLTDSLLSPVDPSSCSYDQLMQDEVLQFRTNCPECNAPADTNMKLTEIPHFKQVVIMATICDACGHKTNEVKSGGGIEDQGVRFEVRVAGRQDFSRDILKSETCSWCIPEVELEVGGRAVGGRFTTAEGLLLATREQLASAPAVAGDVPSTNRGKLDNVISTLEEVLRGNTAITVILDDPAGNSYVQSLADDDSLPDDGLKVTRYERSYEQNDELGLNDMKTERYQHDS